MRDRTAVLGAALVFLAAFALYLRTLAPSVVAMFDDSAELQLVAYQLGIAHPTGYPLYTLLGRLFTLLPFGDPAYRVNLMSAFWGAGAVSLLFWVARQICDVAIKLRSGAVANLTPFALAAAALFFAASPIFWASSTVAEVYTLHLFFVGLTLAIALHYGCPESKASGDGPDATTSGVNSSKAGEGAILTGRTRLVGGETSPPRMNDDVLNTVSHDPIGTSTVMETEGDPHPALSLSEGRGSPSPLPSGYRRSQRTRYPGTESQSPSHLPLQRESHSEPRPPQQVLSPLPSGCPLGAERVRIRVSRAFLKAVSYALRGAANNESAAAPAILSPLLPGCPLGAERVRVRVPRPFFSAAGIRNKGMAIFAFAFGLSLTHHRMMLLLAPAFAIFGLVSLFPTRRGFPWRVTDFLWPVLFFLLPLALYLYLPLRAVSLNSLDGTYENTLAGFLKWTTASGYGVFFTANPWGLTENPIWTYARILVDQFSWPGTALGMVGLVWLFRHFRIWLLLATSLAATVAFALAYRVADMEPFYLPSFFVFAILVAVGVADIIDVAGRLLAAGRSVVTANIANAGLIGKVEGGVPAKASDPGVMSMSDDGICHQTDSVSETGSVSPPTIHMYSGGLGVTRWMGRVAMVVAAVGFLALPVGRAAAGFSARDLGEEDTVLRYGLDVLSQPVERGSTIVGIGGEMTLLKYLQATRSLRSDLTFVTADAEDTRLAAIAGEIAQGHAVYTTRALAGLADKYSLQSVGPLIRVLPTPNRAIAPEARRLSENFGGSIELVGFQVEEASIGPAVIARGTAPGKARPTVRLTFFWRVLDKVPVDFTVFVHVDGSGGRLIGQMDRRPVSGAYATSLWRPGEVIADTYDVPLLVGSPPGAYEVSVGLYDAKGNRLPTAAGANQATIGRIELAKSVPKPPTSMPDTEALDAMWGDNLKLIGYNLGSRAARPGDVVEVDLLWQAIGPIAQDRTISLRLIGSNGQPLAENAAQPTDGAYPPSRWTKDEIVRDMRKLTIPADIVNGVYQVAVGPSSDGKVIALAPIEIKGRQRVFTAPPIDRTIDARFAEGITLLGIGLKKGADSTVAAGDRVDLTLYWQSGGKLTTSYTVFVHLVGSDGRPLAQADAQPQGGAAPTTGWIDGEVVADNHELLIPPGAPPGDYRILVGLYDPASGRRLSVGGADSVTLGKWVVK